MQCFALARHCIRDRVADCHREAVVDLSMRHLYIPLISPCIPGCGWLLNRLEAAEIKVRHQAVGVDDSVSMQVQ